MSALVLIATGACDGARPDGDDDTGGALPRSRDTVVVDGATPSCATCSIEVLPPLRLGTAGDRDIPQRVPDILRDGRGTHYLLFDGWSNKSILRYDSTGRFIGRLGRYGQGPGEYTMTFGAVITPGDSILVMLSGHRAQLFTPEGAFVRPLRLASSGHSIFAVARDGTRDVYATTSGMGWLKGDAPWVVRIGPDGAPGDSFPIFSARLGTSTVNAGLRSERQVTARSSGVPTLAPDGSVWTLTAGNRLERHAPDGTTMQVIGLTLPGRDPPWLSVVQAESAAATKTTDGRYVARIDVHPSNRKVWMRTKETLSVDSTGLLWIVRTTPAPRFDTINVKLQYLAPDEAPHEGTIPREVEDRLYHTIVEVIDPSGPALLARTQLRFLGHAAAPGYVGRVTQDETGHYVSSVYRLRLSRNSLVRE